MKKFHCQIGDEKCVVDADTRWGAVAALGYEVTGVISVDHRQSTYYTKHDGQYVELKVTEMKEDQQ